MSKRTDRAYGKLHRSREGLDKLLTMQAVEGRIDPREADLLWAAIARLNEAWASYAHSVAVDL